jgi:hypothetical protein
MQRYIEDRVRQAGIFKIGNLPAEVLEYKEPDSSEGYAKVKLKLRVNFKGIALPDIEDIPVAGIGGVYPIPVGTRGVCVQLTNDAYGLVVEGDDPRDLEVNEFSELQAINNCVFLPVFTKKDNTELAGSEKVFKALKAIETALAAFNVKLANAASGVSVTLSGTDYVATIKPTDTAEELIGSAVKIGTVGG